MAKPRLDDPLTADQLRSLLDYDPKTGRFTWRPREVRSQYDKTWNTRYADIVAGTLTVPKCYVQIMVLGRLYLAQRLAFLWMTGEWPNPEPDHINNDPSDNRWSNLRIATSSQQKMNTRRRSDNTSGYKGVVWERRRHYWYFEVMVNGKKQTFPNYASAEEAHAARIQVVERLHGEFARHD